MSNFKLGYAWLQTLATITANLTAATTRPLTNLFSGSRSDRFELATASTDILTINYDLGASTTKTANFLAIMRAKLLHRNDCTGVRLRGSTQSATLPSTLTPTAWFDPNRGVTTVSGAVSQWNDLSGNNYHATQGTAANRPLLSRADTCENHVIYSEALQTTPWEIPGLNATVATSITANPVNGGTGVWRITENSATAEHRVSQFPTGGVTASGISIPSGTAMKLSVYARSQASSRNIAIRIWNNITDNYSIVDLSNGTVLVPGAGKTTTVETIGSGWYKVTVAWTTTSTNITAFALQNASGSNYSYLGDSAGAIEVFRPHLRRAASSDTYVTTTACALWSGINGNRALVFDGSNDTFTNTLTVNPTGGMWASFAVRVNTTTAIDHGVISSIGAAQRLRVFINAGGGITVRVMNGGAAYIGRTAPASTIVAGTTAIVTFTYDGGTAASGIKIYKNGVQVDTADSNAGVYTVPTAGAVLVIGELSAGDRLNGLLGDLIFVQGATLSAGNLTAITEQLTSKYITSPIVQLDSLSTQTLMGPNDEDYFTVFTESSAFRHWWLELVNEGTASKYNCSKVFFGKALDFGREPQLPISIDQSRQAPWSREAALSTTINLGPISDTNKETFLNEVVKNSDVMPVVALDPAAYVFNDSKGMHCKISDHNVDPYFGADNDISITLEEEI